MEKEQVSRLVTAQRAFYLTGATLPVAVRKNALKKLYAAIQANGAKLTQALQEDLGKDPTEGFMCEIGLVQTELSHMIRHVERYAKDKTVPTPLPQFASHSYTTATPYGTVLIMSPWNYPVLLTLGPLVDALAAGNTAIVKPSAYSPATSQVLKEMLEETFPQEYVAVVTGGRAENQSLLEEKFDYIFFTGGTSTARTVLEAAAKHLTPTTLELGGKSPCVVTASAKLPLAARRIVFGKYINCGQTCVAPDYILCDRKIKDQLVQHLRREIVRQYGQEPLTRENYGRIVNQKHFTRLVSLLDQGTVVIGGETNPDTLQIAPTVICDPAMNLPLMTEEIFGPILPIICYDELSEVIEFLSHRPKPLAMYVFSEKGKEAKDLMARCRFGGGCINDTIIHLATTEMPFGGVGESGMGGYHGKVGFDTFCHRKSIVDKKTWMDLPMRYRPYTKTAKALLRMFLR